MIGGYDPDSRRTFEWNEDNWDKDLFQTIKELIQLRKEKIKGKLRMFTEGEIFVIEREKIFLAVNNTNNMLKYGKITLEPYSYKIIYER